MAIEDSKDLRVVGKYAPVVIYKCMVGECKELRRTAAAIESHIIADHLERLRDKSTPKT